MTRGILSGRRTAAARQRGVLTLLFALMLPALLCMAGVALDLALVYQRKVQLQNYADAVALAAARSLNGTAAGVNDAAAKAMEIANGQLYAGAGLPWQSAALRFSATPDAPDAAWLDAASAAAAGAAPGMAYAKVDTSELEAGTVNISFLRLAGVAGPVSASGRAVAGRAGTRVTPLAVCAMGAATGVRNNPGAAGGAASELLQYGFRFGVSYNLLKLNPAAGATEPEYFLVDPIQGGGAGPAGPVDHMADAVLAPFMCSGTVQLPRLKDATLRLRRPADFTLGEQLNSRFGQYGTGALACSPVTAPPDTNVRQHVGAWMTTAPNAASADPAPGAGGLPYNTVADRSSAPGAAAYGPLWAYGAARQSPGGAVIPRAQWPFLYPVDSGAVPSAPAYGAAPPYAQTNATNFLAPGKPGVALRRMLVIPLLQCPVAAGTDAQATVLALAQFLMLEHASGAGVRAEFAGVVDESTLAGAVELYR